MLLTTLLPWKTASFILEKLESNKTILATFLVAAAPFAKAIEQSACLKANKSFKPSPVTPTIRLFFFKIAMISAFWSGVTLPNIALFKTSSSKLS